MSEPRHGPEGTYRPFSGRLPTMAEALSAVLAAVPAPRAQPEHLWLDDALGRFLAADMTSAEDIPGFDRSTVDGYAVRAGDTAGAAGDRPVRLAWAGRVDMGRRPDAVLKPGQAISVATGAMLPEGADAVVMVEDTLPAAPGALGEPGAVTVLKTVEPGENVLPRGSDLRAGEVVLPAGTRLGPAQLGALAAAGIVEVPVHPVPSVAVLSTGDELVPPQRTPAPGAVRDANTYALAAAVRRDGGRVVRLGRAGDDGERLAAILKAAVEQVDIVLVSGGSSVGVHDLTVDAVQAAGGRVIVHGIAVKPGKPTLVASRGECLIFGLPGNPVSALVVYDLLVRPALLARMGAAEPPRLRVEQAVLAGGVRRPASREEAVRVRLTHRGQRLLPVAERVAGTSGMLQSLARADGYLWIGFDREGFEDGEIVQVWRIPGN
ncbi:MAG TPA: gephyrin-like molybdotransferase Glp [Bacillota bacterium]